MLQSDLTPDSFMALRYPKAHAGTEQKRSSAKSEQQTEDIITGTLDIPLAPDGLRDARKMAARVKNVKVLFHSPTKRAAETSAEYAKAAGKGAKDVAEKALGPWNLGEYQGRPQHDVDKFINDFMTKKPDEKVPGGTSYNTFKNPIIGLLQKQIAAWKPGQRILDITHSIGVHTIQAWIENGAPEDKSISKEAILNRKKLQPVALFRINPRNMTMKPATHSGPDGIYIGRHADTVFDNIDKGARPQ